MALEIDCIVVVYQPRRIGLYFIPGSLTMIYTSSIMYNYFHENIVWKQ